MSSAVSPRIVFLGYDRSHGLLYHLADWLAALASEAGDEFEIVGLSEPGEQEPGLLTRLRSCRGLHLQIVESLSDPSAADTLSRAALVHCHGFRQLAQLNRLRRTLQASYRCVLSVHNFRNGTPLRVPFTNYVSAAILNKGVQMIHFLSMRSYAEFTHANFMLKRALPYHIFPLGCNATEFSASSQQVPPPEWEHMAALTAGRANIVYLANFSRGKKHRWLLDALAASLSRRNAILWLLGDGPERQGILRQVKKRGLSNCVICPGRVQRRYVPWILSRMQVAVCPSLSENSPHSIMEPLFAGVPVVTFDVGTASQLVSDFSRGFVLGKPRVQKEFARKVDVILGDPCLQRRMAEEAKRLATQFYTWRTCAANSLAMYRSMLQLETPCISSR
jgi:glycosyltransferase involved in cell wall biosynthesis